MSITREDVQSLSPGEDAFSITPSDVGFIRQTRGIYIAAGTTLTVEMAGGGIVTFTNPAVGVIHPLRVVRVLNTGTNATGVIGIL